MRKGADLSNNAKRNIKVIAITGGACAGKTTFMDIIRDKADIAGYRIMIIPEAATMLSQGGISYLDGEEEFQRAVMSAQIFLEEVYTAHASAVGGKIAIICDRGILDGAAYVSKEVLSRLLEEHGISRDDALSRYDAVIYLESAAVSDPDSYSCDSNDARREGLEEAAALETRTKMCWNGHPSVTMVKSGKGANGFAAKMESAMDALEAVLSDENTL